MYEKYFRFKEDQPTWYKLWYYLDLSETEFGDLVTDAKESIECSKLNNITDILHTVSMLVYFKEKNLIFFSVENLLVLAVDQFKKVVNLQENIKKLDYFDISEESGGYGLYARELPIFKKFIEDLAQAYEDKYVEKNIERVKELLGAENIIFISDAHEKFYYEKLKEVRYQDVYHKALCYCLGISDDTRRNVYRIYDFKTGCVITECLHEGWQTSGSVRVIRMAFNLYCNGTPSVSDYEDAEEQVDECRQYTVEEIFCCAYAPYFWQAIQIRYPEYATYNHKLYALLGGTD